MDVIINAECHSVPEKSARIEGTSNFYHNLLLCAGYMSEYPPVAELLRQYYGLEGQWLIVSPVYWQATHNDVMLIASEHELKLSADESRRWFAAVAKFAESLDVEMYYCSEDVWLVKVDGKPYLTSKPVHSLLHQSLMPQLRALDETHYWQRVLTESQMFLQTHSHHSENTTIASKVNGIWLWGGGLLNAPIKKPIFYGSEVLQGFAKILSIQHSPYKREQPLKKNSILLLENISHPALNDLQIQLQNMTVRWYWNNIAYITKPKHWWSGLWGM